MSLDKKCPKCGSTKVQLSSVKSKHSVLWLILFGWAWIFWIMCKWMIGFMILIFYDWWMDIIAKSKNRGYVWKSKGWFTLSSKTYYCHNCNHNFKA